MAYLEVIRGSESKKYFDIPNECSIGRTPDNIICINESRVSRKHAIIKQLGRNFVIEDLGSKNGVLVNNKPIESYRPQPLYDNDMIQISTAEIIYHATGEVVEKDSKSFSSTQEMASDGDRPFSHLMGGLSVVMKLDDPESLADNATIQGANVLEISKEESVEGLKEAVKRFQAMVKISSELGTVTKSELLLEKIMDNIFDIFPNAERSFIMRYNSDTQEMEPVAGRRREGLDRKDEQVELSQTIITAVIEKRQSVLSSNAMQDARFKGVHSIADFSIRSFMYVPFIYKDEILGMISVDTTSIKDTFNKNDLAMLTGIAAQAAVALKNVLLYKQVEEETQSRTQLSRYLSPDIVEGVLDGSIPFMLGGEDKFGTVLFCDIVGFTSMSEELTAVEVIERLNQYFLLVTKVVTNNKGTLHKFEGDMVMAFWNVMVADDNADINAVKTGLEMQNAVWLFGQEVVAQGHKPIYLGVGCNTGAFAGGNVGGDDKMEYTVIGDNINIAKRIESLAGRWQVFIAKSTYDSIKDDAIVIGLPDRVVKGKSQPVKIYSVRGLKVSEEECLFCAPIIFCKDTPQTEGKGLITACHYDKGIKKVVLYTTEKVCDEEILQFELDLPEGNSKGVVKGLVFTSETIEANDKQLYTRVELEDIKAPPEILAFFKPGYIEESLKDWDQLERR